MSLPKGRSAKDSCLPIRTMTVEEKVAQLCAVRDKQLLKDGKLSSRRLKKHLQNGIGFLTNLSRHLEPASAVRVANEVQEFLIHETRPGLPAILTCPHQRYQSLL